MSDQVPNFGEIKAMAREAWLKLSEGKTLNWEQATAFEHVYGSALSAKRHGPGIAQAFGEAYEGQTWGRMKKDPWGPRDAYADLYNNALGRRLAKGASESDLAGAAFRTVMGETAIVRRKEAGADPRIPQDVDGSARPGRMAHHALMDERADFEARTRGRAPAPRRPLHEREQERPWVSFEGG